MVWTGLMTGLLLVICLLVVLQFTIKKNIMVHPDYAANMTMVSSKAARQCRRGNVFSPVALVANTTDTPQHDAADHAYIILSKLNDDTSIPSGCA